DFVDLAYRLARLGHHVHAIVVAAGRRNRFRLNVLLERSDIKTLDCYRVFTYGPKVRKRNEDHWVVLYSRRNHETEHGLRARIVKHFMDAAYLPRRGVRYDWNVHQV